MGLEGIHEISWDMNESELTIHNHLSVCLKMGYTGLKLLFGSSENRIRMDQNPMDLGNPFGVLIKHHHVQYPPCLGPE